MTKPLKEAIASATSDVVVATPVKIVPREGRPMPKVTQELVYLDPPDINGEIVRIINNADPLQFLMDVMHGKAVPIFIVSEGEDGELEVETEFENADVSERIAVAKWLAGRWLPPATKKHQPMKTLEAQQSEDRMDQMLTHAAANRNATER